MYGLKCVKRHLTRGWVVRLLGGTGILPVGQATKEKRRKTVRSKPPDGARSRWRAEETRPIGRFEPADFFRRRTMRRRGLISIKVLCLLTLLAALVLADHSCTTSTNKGLGCTTTTRH